MKNSGQSIAPAIQNSEDARVSLLPEVEVGTTEFKSEDRSLDAARVIWSRRGLVLRAAIRGAVVALLIALLIPNRYSSTTRLMPPESKAGSGLALLTSFLSSGSSGGGIPLAANLFDLNSSGALFVGILRSRTVEDRLIDQFSLRKVYWFAWTAKAARERLESNTDTSEDRKSGIITITVTDTNRQRARDLAQAYVRELDRLVAQLTTSSAHRERVFLEERLRAVKEDLDSAEKEFSEFASKNTTIDIKEQGKAMVEAASILQGQLIAAQSELKGLEQIYSDNNVRVRTLSARVAELQRQLEKLAGADMSSQGNSTAAGEASASTHQSIYPSIRQLPLLGVSYADLYRRTRIQETVYETLTKEYEMAKVQEAKEIPSVKVLDAANVPERKSFPPTLLMTWSGFSLALVGAAVWVLAENRWTKLDPEDPRREFVAEVSSTLNARVRGMRWRDFPVKFVREVLGRRIGRRSDDTEVS